MSRPKSAQKNIRKFIFFLFHENEKIENYDNFFFFFILLLRYIDTQSNRKLNASTAFQLLVRPGSYTMGPGKGSVDGLESTEWATKEAGATVIIALLIHLDEF